MPCGKLDSQSDGTQSNVNDSLGQLPLERAGSAHLICAARLLGQ